MRTDGEESNKQEKKKACGKIFPAVCSKLEFFSWYVSWFQRVQESDGKEVLARKESFREDKVDDMEVRRKSNSKLTSQGIN